MDVDLPHTNWQPATAGTICARCNLSAPHPPHVNTHISNAPNTDPWCASCIKARFDRARDHEAKFPFVKHDVVQHPRMKQYAGIFDDGYITDYKKKTAEWYVVERRVYCDCSERPFVGKINASATTIHASCNDCGKVWCMRCGEHDTSAGFSFGSFSMHGNAIYPDYCRENLTNRDETFEEQFEGLTFGHDYQVCPRCHLASLDKTDPKNKVCEGCKTAFCFLCGFAKRGQTWLVGYPTCSC